MKNLLNISLFALIVSNGIGCKEENTNVSQVDVTLNTAVLNDFSDHVAQASYNDLKTKATKLYTDIQALNENTTDENLEACQTSWRAARQAWEQTESFLFGPVSTEDVDPRIDTWPVDFNALDSLLASDNQFSQGEIGDLQDALKGFHPIEYLIFGEAGDKVAGDFTARQLEYLVALGLNVKQLTTEVADSWNPSNADNYSTKFTTAGNGSAEYATQRAAFEEMVSAMTDICNEVANAKILEVYHAQDASLEESPFAKNSITDFTNNIKGVQNVYLAKYTTDGKGLEDMVRNSNLSLDAEIKTNINSSIAALNTITVPFGEAITSQPVQVQNAVDAINALKTTLEEKLLPFIRQHSK